MSQNAFVNKSLQKVLKVNLTNLDVILSIKVSLEDEK